MRIVPMRDLKDTVKIEKICGESKEPVFVTKNGYGRLVVMDIECFEDVFFKTYEAKIINEALQSLDDVDGRDGRDVLEEIRQKYGL